MSNYTLPPPQPVPPPPKGSSTRGCLKWAAIGCGILTLLGALAAVAIVLVVFAAIRSTDLYEDAMAKVMKDPRVSAALGEPIKERWWLTGQVNVDDDMGEADIRIPIKGPKGAATVYVVAKLLGGRWEYSRLIVRPAGGADIDLLRQNPAVQPLQPVHP